MPNNFTSAFKKQVFDPTMTDPFLFLVKLSHASWASDVRLVNNNESITSNGDLYDAAPMLVKLPQEDGQSVPIVQLEIDNISLELIEEIRSITSPITAAIYGVLGSDPDNVEMSLEELLITSISYNAAKITATLVLDDFLNQGIPGEKYDPSTYPSLF